MSDGHDNLIPFDKRTEDEQREIAKKGGQASGRVRAQKANFRKMLNQLLTAKIDDDEIVSELEELGVDNTMEAAANLAMLKAALNGDTKAFDLIAKYSGQTAKTDLDNREQRARIEHLKAQTEKVKGSDAAKSSRKVIIVNDTGDKRKGDQNK